MVKMDFGGSTMYAPIMTMPLQLGRRIMLGAMLALWAMCLQAATYSHVSTTFSWIDTSAAPFTKIGYNTTPYKLNAGGSPACGTTPPRLDDTISDLIPIGFTFQYGTNTYTQVRVQSNGRLEFNNTACGYGTASVGPPQTYPYLYPDTNMNNTMKVFGVDLDSTNLVDVPNYPAAARKTSCLSINSCYISVGSTGTAPNRKFVVTWYHVPEWVSASNTSGSFDVQVVLNEDGSFVYQYGTVSHGGTGSAQIGWQLSTTDYGVLTFGASSEPPPSTAILFYIPAPVLAYYQFEEGAWGKDLAGQVVDSSGNNWHGQAKGNTQTTATGYVCRGADIPLNSTAATVDAVQTGINISSFPALLGTGSVMLWYKANAAWNSGASAQLLDATTVNGQWFFLSKTASGTLYFEIVDSTGAVRSVETAAQTFAAGTWQHIAVAWNFNALQATNSDRLSIFINGGAATTSSFSSSGTVASSAGLISIGDNPLGVTDTKGSINSANGTIDEVQIFNFEATQSQVIARKALSHACGTYIVDHLELRHASWSGVACVPGTMTVFACQDSSFPCTNPYTKGLVATLSATGGQTTWVPSGGATTVIPYNASSTTKDFYVGVGSTTLGASSVPLNTSVTRCNGVANSCVWSSSNAGLLVTAAVTDVGGNGVIVGGQPTAISVQAVKSVSATPVMACEAIKGLTSAGLKVWTTATTPVSYPSTSSSNGATVGGSPRISNASAGTYLYSPQAQPTSDNVTSFTFDSNATTTLWVKHMDTGQWTLSVKLDTVGTASFPALSLSGSGVIKTLPVGYGVTLPAAWLAPAVTQAACLSGQSAACDAAAAADAKVAAAGDSFTSTVTAALWTSASDADFSDNPVAPSYSGSVTLASALQAPSGGSAGTLTANSATLTGGTSSSFTQAWSQSGAVRIAASGSYLSQSVSSLTPVLGRVVPRYFRTTLTTAACGSGATAFTYSKQPITTVTVDAMDGATTALVTPNYKGGFARPVTISNGNTPDVGSFSANTIAATAFTAGSATVSPVYTFTSLSTPPKTLALRASDCAASSLTPTVCNSPLVIEVNSQSVAGAEAAARIFSGRLGLKNAYGSELLPLPVPAQAEYFLSGGWVRNVSDNCTKLVVPTNANIGLVFAAQTGRNQLSAGETTAKMRGGVISPATLLAGDSQLTLSAPGAGNYGYVDVAGSVLLSNGSPAPSVWLSPVPTSARACFGVCGSRTPVIYSRERY
jgi:MSHA biogenesis protein MshQ